MTSAVKLVRVGVAQVHPQQLVAKSAASSPPAPARISRMTSRSSFGSRGSSRTLSSSRRRVFVGLERRRSRRGPSPGSPRRRHPCRAAPARRPARCGCLQPAEGLDRRLQAGHLLAKPAECAGVRGDSGRGQLGLDVVVLAGDLGKLGVELAHDPGGGSVGVGAAPGVTPGPPAGRRQVRQPEDDRPALELRRPVRHGLAVGRERLLHRHDGDFDHVVGRAAWW